MSAEVVRAAAGGVLIGSVLDAERLPRRAFDCGRGFEGFVIDLGGNLLVIHGRCRRERERSNEEGSGEAERRFPFIGVAQNRNIRMLCRRSVF